MIDQEKTEAVGSENPAEEVTKEVEKTEAEVESPEKDTIEKPVMKDDIADFYNPKKKEEVKKQVVKEEEIKYEFKKVDGVDFEDAVFEKVRDFSRGSKLTADNAQKVIDLAAEAVKAERKKTESIVVDRVKAWDEQTRRDKEIGGAALPENVKVIKGFLNKYGNDEVMNILRQTGLASHPEVLRMFYKAGKAITEDGFVTDPGIARNSKPHNKNEIGETIFKFPSLEKKQ